MTTVVKIGGSLFPEHTERLCEYLAKTDEKLVLITGGGDFANRLREYNDDYNFSDDVMHWSAIKSMDIIGELTASKNDDIVCVDNLEDIEKVHDDNKMALLLCYDILKKEDVLKHSWDVTSDSIACYFAHRLNGIYNGNIFSNDKKLIKNISAKELLIFEETCVDKCLPELLIKYNLDCFVMNGIYPKRVLCHLNGNHTIHTHIRR